MLIEVQETHPPAGARRSGTVVTTDGTRLDCWPNLMKSIQVGKRYDVETSTNERGYTSITKATPATDAPAQESSSGQTGRSDVADEAEFVGKALAALIMKGDVIYTKKSLYEATLLLRDLYDATFKKREGNANAQQRH
jgi:hypothetical protein